MDASLPLNFTLLLCLLLLGSFGFWLLERLLLAPRRAAAAAAARTALGARRDALLAQGIKLDPSLSDASIAATHDRLARQPWWLEWTAGLFPVIAVVFVLRSFIAEPFKIPSGSMESTLVPGDLILVNKFTYGPRIPLLYSQLWAGRAPSAGDVIVFRKPREEGVDYIKRIVGVPGDTVSYEDKKLTINGQPVPQVADGEWLDPATLVDYQQFDETLGGVRHKVLINPQVPPFVLGGPEDFPQRGQCSYNAKGFVCQVPAGQYFVMGDNRDNSLDSRYWGFVPASNITGRAFVVWMNLSSPKNIGVIH